MIGIQISYYALSMVNVLWIYSLLLISYFALAQNGSDWEVLKKKLKNRPAVLMSQTMNRKISRVHRLISKKNLKSVEKAQSILMGITKSSFLGYEKAEAYRLLGMSAIHQKEFNSSIRFFKKSMDFNTLSYQQYLDVILILSQIHLNLKEPQSKKKAQKYLQQWFALSDKPKPKAYALMGYIYYMQDNKKKALEEIQKAISFSTKPKKQWLGVAVNIHLELKNYELAEKLLHRLLTLYPDSQSHWRQQSNVFFNIGDNKKALASYQLAHKVKPFKKERVLKELSNFLNMQGIPFKAAKNWQQALKEKKAKETSKHYSYLGDLWSKSEEIEKAIEAYKKAIFLPDTSPVVYVKLSSLYFLWQKWRKGVEVLEKALSMDNDIENKDGLYVQVGFAYYYLKEYQKSLHYFYKAEKIRGDNEITARQWIRQVKQYL